jgi:hypothetical protein
MRRAEMGTSRGGEKARETGAVGALKPIIGIAKQLPPDASSKIDEVLYGRTDS